MRDDTLVHLQWALGFDWDAMEVPPGRRVRGDRLTRITAWRRGRAPGDPGCDRFEAVAGWAPREATWDALVEVQAALGCPARFRDGPAFCRDRDYGWRPGLQERFARKLAHDAQRGHPVVAATRLYLDIVHMHPFPDGNARAAVLWAAWTLERGGCAVPDMEALVRLPKPAGDPRVAAWMVRALATSAASDPGACGAR